MFSTDSNEKNLKNYQSDFFIREVFNVRTWTESIIIKSYSIIK